jgi:hypothetical protein
MNGAKLGNHVYQRINMDFNEIRRACHLKYDLNDPISRSAMVGFRNIFDPYCAEYKDADNDLRLEILRRMLNDGIITNVVVFYHAFMQTFREHDRADIANAAGDGLAILVTHAAIKGNSHVGV